MPVAHAMVAEALLRPTNKQGTASWRRMAIIASALIFSLLTIGRARATETNIQLMIVGVSHFVAHRDVNNSHFLDNPLSAERQAQIRQVVERLSAFHPTKVLIEDPVDDQKYAQRFADYLAGRYVLPPSEDYQFGFRLAKEAGAAIYPVDTWGPSIVDDNSPQGKAIDAYLVANLPHVSAPAAIAFQAKSDSLEQTGTYLDLLRFLNTDDAIRANASWYSVAVGMGRTHNFAGTSYVAQWYTRNCYIFANILSVLDPGDRAVVIFGQGHEYLLREFARLNPNVVYVDPLTYLR
ncbi:MAG: DUF5694 domain-containing protein [Candidatus Cybelea sp.]